MTSPERSRIMRAAYALNPKRCPICNEPISWLRRALATCGPAHGLIYRSARAPDNRLERLRRLERQREERLDRLREENHILRLLLTAELRKRRFDLPLPSPLPTTNGSLFSTATPTLQPCAPP